jgi:hypothetical protein
MTNELEQTNSFSNKQPERNILKPHPTTSKAWNTGTGVMNIGQSNRQNKNSSQTNTKGISLRCPERENSVAVVT